MSIAAVANTPTELLNPGIDKGVTEDLQGKPLRGPDRVAGVSGVQLEHQFTHVRWCLL